MQKSLILAGLLAFCCHAGAESRAQDPAGRPMYAGQIVKKLSKDIVLARPGERQPAAPSVDLQVQFAFNSAELLPEGRSQLDELGRALNDKALAGWGFELAGHTDQVGSAAYNLTLSRERASAVKNYLMVSHGLNPQRLIPQGFGFARLADPAHPTAAVNRRVEVRRVTLATNNQGALMAPARSSQPGGRMVPAQ